MGTELEGRVAVITGGVTVALLYVYLRLARPE